MGLFKQNIDQANTGNTSAPVLEPVERTSLKRCFDKLSNRNEAGRFNVPGIVINRKEICTQA